MFYVYILKSINYPEKTYVGYSHNINQRLDAHNNGESVYASKYKPWALHAYFAFHKETTAIDFEKYLKSASGKAFTKTHFL